MSANIYLNNPQVFILHKTFFVASVLERVTRWQFNTLFHLKDFQNLIKLKTTIIVENNRFFEHHKNLFIKIKLMKNCRNYTFSEDDSSQKLKVIVWLKLWEIAWMITKNSYLPKFETAKP